MPKYRSRVGSKSRTLKATRNKTVKDFKSVDNYLDSVYRNNKEYLDKYIDKLGDSRTKRNIFKEEVKKYMRLTNPETGKPYNIRQAIDRVQRSTMITTKEERIGEVRLERMKELDPEAFKSFRQKIGWRNKVSSMNFVEETHEGNKNILRYRDNATGKDVVIIETISPKSGMSKGYEIKDYTDWRYDYAKEHRNDSPQANADWVVQQALKKGRGE